MAKQPLPDAPSIDGRRRGRPALSPVARHRVERQIAHEALRLFTEHGVGATTVTEIAAASGVSIRTFWRHFTSKEACIRPLLDAGLDETVGRVRMVGSKSSLANAWVFGPPLNIVEIDDIVSLLRLGRENPSIRAVWLQAHDDGVEALLPAVADHFQVPLDSFEARVKSAALNAALAIAIEEFALNNQLERSLTAILLDAVRACGVDTGSP